MNSTEKAKRIDGLMRHLRDDCNISISGRKEKLQLMFLKEYEECINELYHQLPLPIYNKIVSTGIKGKLIKLKAYIGK
ncbi:MAG: hypothetical protein IJP31_05935 [Lachnospiraceae bacterium]|nr:hypothetical protein [Lachnospiraceae bacterium]